MLGEKVKYLRKVSGLSQAELAAQVGVGQTFIGQIERGEKQPSVGKLMNLATCLGVSMDELLRPEPADIAHSSAERV